MPPIDDVLVLGGGIVGAAVALHCAERGLAVRVLDRAERGGASTARSMGYVDVLGPCPPAYLRARREAVAETAAWLGEEGRTAAGWQACGSLNPEAGRDAVPVLLAGGVRAEWWSAARVAEEEPAFHAPGPGAVHLPDDACLDPVRYLALTRAAARRAGVRWERREAAGVARAAGGAWSAAGHVARRVVVAAGVWSGALLPGLALGPDRGTVLEVAGPAAPLLRRYTPSLRALPDGRVWIGGSHEPGRGEIDEASAAAEERAGRLLAAALRELPALAGAVRRRLWVGIRPMPADGLPLAGPWRGAPGLFVCVTHSGVTMAQWLGRRMAGLLCGDPVPELAPFRPDR